MKLAHNPACPKCGTVLANVGCVESKSGEVDFQRMPQAGDYVICKGCLALNKMDPTINMVAVSDDEIAAMKAEDRQYLDQLLAIMRRAGYPKH